MNRRISNGVLTLGCIVALVASSLHFHGDRFGRVRVRAFVHRFQLEKRRPEIVRTLAYAPSPAWAIEILADTALRDAFEVIDLTNATPDVREAWITAARELDNELKASREALLDTIARHVGWPFYQSLLGQTSFTIQSRNLDPELIKRSESWSRPLLNAARSVPSAPHLWRTLGATYLRTWPVLADVHRSTADEVFGHAFQESYFVAVGFPAAVELLGAELAISHLPDIPSALRAAFESFANANDTARAWELHQRWERVEWNTRVRDLAEIEEPGWWGGSADAGSACGRWIRNHSVWQFDTPAAHRQAARLLDLCPTRQHGAWSTDVVADVARYLMTRRGGERFRPSIARHVGTSPGLQNTAAEKAAITDPSRGGLDRKMSVCGVGQLLVQSEMPDFPITVRVTAQNPAVVDIGLNRARAATLLVANMREVTLIPQGRPAATVSLNPLSGDRNSCMEVLIGAAK